MKILEILFTVMAAIALGLIIAAIIAYPVMLLWNGVIPKIFGLSEISFMDALQLSLLCSLLFKSFGSENKN